MTQFKLIICVGVGVRLGTYPTPGQPNPSSICASSCFKLWLQ